MSADYSKQDEYCCDVDYGNLPADYVFVQQVDTADDQCDCTCFTDTAAYVTNDQVAQGSAQACACWAG